MLAITAYPGLLVDNIYLLTAPEDALVGLPVTLSAGVPYSANDIQEIVWEMGDGVTLFGNPVKHI